MDNQNQQNINIKISDDVLKGNYSNNLFVSHNKEEFVLDFINISFFPPPGQGIAIAKVITSPSHFKRMVTALSENLSKYEEQFGKVENTNPVQPSVPSSSSDRPFGFGNK